MAGDAIKNIRQIKQADGKDIVLWGSISLTQSLIKAGLIDEYHLQVCPTIVGGGKLLFPAITGYKDLKLISSRQYANGVIFLTYRA